MTKLRVSIPGAILLVSILVFTLGCASGSPSTVEKPVTPDTSDTPEKPVEPERPEPTVVESLNEYSSVEDLDKALAVLEEADILTLEQEILKAALLVANGDYDEARGVLNRLLDENPGHNEVLYNLALLDNAEGRVEERDRLVSEILSTDPEHEGALLIKGSVDLSAKRYEDANKSFLTILQNNPNNFMALSGGGSAQMNLDQLESSIKLLDRAIALEPGFAYLYVDRARAWKGLKNYGNSEDDYGKAIELEPEVEWHYLDRARVRIQYFHNLEGAWEDLKILESINPDNLFANIYMAGILDEWKRFDEAKVYFEKVLAARPDYGYAHEPLAKYAYMNGDFNAARNHFLQSYNFDDRDPLVALAAALCMEKSGDRKSAESLLKQVGTRLDRDSVEYEMFRYYLSPGSSFFISDKVAKEKNEDLRSRMYFYMGARDDLKGLRKTALAFYEKVEDDTGFFESDLAAWERNNP